MKVLLINGSPRKKECTGRALEEVAKTLVEDGIEVETIHIGALNIPGCKACGACKKNGKCIFNDIVNEVNEKFKDADGIIVGSPVYYASPNGTLISFLDRLFQSASFDKSMKVGACVVACRRGGASSSFEVLNKYFTIANMPVCSSTYWNSVHGFSRSDVEKDLEGLQVMRNLAHSMAFLIKSINLGMEKYGMPIKERKYFTSFPDGK